MARNDDLFNPAQIFSVSAWSIALNAFEGTAVHPHLIPGDPIGYSS